MRKWIIQGWLGLLGLPRTERLTAENCGVTPKQILLPMNVWLCCGVQVRHRCPCTDNVACGAESRTVQLFAQKGLLVPDAPDERLLEEVIQTL